MTDRLKPYVPDLVGNHLDTGPYLYYISEADRPTRDPVWFISMEPVASDVGHGHPGNQRVEIHSPMYGTDGLGFRPMLQRMYSKQLRPQLPLLTAVLPADLVQYGPPAARAALVAPYVGCAI